MAKQSARFPDLRILADGLQAALDGGPFPCSSMTILQREPNPNASTFPSEIVTCRLADGSRRRLLCKYMAEGWDSDHGHRGGGAYEADVYRHVLKPLEVSVPEFYGAHHDIHSRKVWLILEYLDGSFDMTETPEKEPELLAARWIGKFHAANEASVARLRFLHRYGADYYLGWARRGARLARRWYQRFAWVPTLCERFREALNLLISSAPTVIHGEYYPMNLLVRDGVLYPVDWESAGIAAGEIDLASLTEAWPAKSVRRMELEYERARWPQGAPLGWKDRLAASRLYLCFRWLADDPEQTTGGPVPWYLRQLRREAERLALI